MSSDAATDSPCGNLVKAYAFAARYHRDQRRKNDDTPYINHPLEVANILVEAGIHESAVLQAAVLHSVVEDTAATIDMVRKEFGDTVADIVEEVTDDKTMREDLRKRDQIECLRRASRGARLVRPACKIHNCRDIVRCGVPHGWSAKYTQGYILWSWQVICSGDVPVDMTIMFLSTVSNKNFKLDGKTYPCYDKHKDTDDNTFLEEHFYAACRK